ncbi:IclR family transcriptional regulator [Neoaquamicrobium sediminum]|uniref:IclR family transcriptional regulator n=2 Tax=Neoaquamicrobium sediminum TaxID=1849104 RepID=UPI0028AAA31C|nr:IclR family transcriptional regulator [Mesorhizobium sediminum]
MAGSFARAIRAQTPLKHGTFRMLVKQAANVLDLLEFFAEQKKAASLAEVSQHFGWPRSSTFNLLSTLVARGFLYEPEARGRFYPTPRWLTLAQEVAAAEPLPEALLSLLNDLAKRTGETVWIAAPSGQHAIFLEVIESKASVRYTASVGTRVPLHATATGQAIISQLSPAQQATLLRKAVFKRYGEGTPMSIEAVETSIRQSLNRGWFVSSSAFTPDLGGIGLPIVFGDRVFAITVAGPWFRVGERLDEFAHIIHSAIALHFGPDYVKKNIKGLRSLLPENG